MYLLSSICYSFFSSDKRSFALNFFYYDIVFTYEFFFSYGYTREAMHLTKWCKQQAPLLDSLLDSELSKELIRLYRTLGFVSLTFKAVDIFSEKNGNKKEVILILLAFVFSSNLDIFSLNCCYVLLVVTSKSVLPTCILFCIYWHITIHLFSRSI